MNKFKFAKDFLSAKITGKTQFFQAILNITGRCNLSCGYCIANSKNRKLKDLSTEVWLEVIDYLINQGVQKINLCGGEPLLRDDIDVFIDKIVKSGVDCYVNTNGILVPQKIDLLKNISCLAISVDGNKESNDSQRGKGTYDKVIEALEAAKNANIPLQLAQVLGPHSLKQIDYMLDFAKKYDAVLNIIPILPRRDGPELKNEISYSDEFYSAIKKVRDLIAQGERIACSTKSWDIFLDWPRDLGKEFILKTDQIDLKKVKHAKCYAGRFYCLIESNGDVYPCCSTVTKIGNILETPLAELAPKMKNHPCQACCTPHSTEMNLLFSLDCTAIRSLLKIYR